jgi:putative transposase
MHWKVINSLLKEHSKIIIGKFNVKSILQSSTITKPAKRKLKALSHYGFKTKLIYKAASLGKEVKTWSEWGTTKGCPCCGHKIKITLSERIFRCNYCNYEAGRDDKAACCIMLKYLSGVW